MQKSYIKKSMRLHINIVQMTKYAHNECFVTYREKKIT